MSKRLICLISVLCVALLVAPMLLAQEAPETPLTVIELAGPASEQDAELSSLDWHAGHLILMTENPNIYATEGNAGMIYALNKDDILAYLLAKAYGRSPAPLEPFAIPVVGPDIAATVPDFDGFEAVAFSGDDVYLMIEAETDTPPAMHGYLVKGSLQAQPGLQITLDLENRVEIKGQMACENMAYENLFVVGDQVVTFFEANGAAVNENRQALVFNKNLEQVGSIPFPAVEFRVTDATVLDADGQFWAINYFFPGDECLVTDSDPIGEKYGKGPTHSQFPQVERLIELRYTEAGIELIDAAPIQLELVGEDARNLEGIARLNDLGLLVVTDKYPQTILGFVPFPVE